MLGEYERFRANALACQEASQRKKIPLIIEKEDISYAEKGDFAGVLIPCLSAEVTPAGYVLENMFSVRGTSYLEVIEHLVEEKRFVAGKAYAIVVGGRVGENYVAQFEPAAYKV
jgi:hypothetical protein